LEIDINAGMHSGDAKSGVLGDVQVCIYCTQNDINSIARTQKEKGDRAGERERVREEKVITDMGKSVLIQEANQKRILPIVAHLESKV
jgi:hypothetical protein